MWHLINPKLRATVNKKQVLEFFADLMYAAIDLNRRLIEAKDDSEMK